LARTLAKTLSYRVLIICLDFSVIYLFTGRVSVAAGFTVVSNVYTTLAYLIHERVWDRVAWGRRIPLRTNDTPLHDNQPQAAS
jgi:adenylylsulfate kinase